MEHDAVGKFVHYSNRPRPIRVLVTRVIFGRENVFEVHWRDKVLAILCILILCLSNSLEAVTASVVAPGFQPEQTSEGDSGEQEYINDWVHRRKRGAQCL